MSKKKKVAVYSGCGNMEMQQNEKFYIVYKKDNHGQCETFGPHWLLGKWMYYVCICWGAKLNSDDCRTRDALIFYECVC